jgi:hypothetical protein
MADGMTRSGSARNQTGAEFPALLGVPMAIKDVLCVVISAARAVHVILETSYRHLLPLPERLIEAEL